MEVVQRKPYLLSFSWLNGSDATIIFLRGLLVVTDASMYLSCYKKLQYSASVLNHMISNEIRNCDTRGGFIFRWEIHFL